MTSHYSISNAPSAPTKLYDHHRFEKIAAGVDPQKAHNHAMRMVHEAGWYKGEGGRWKRLHADLTDKINIREPILQPDGRYVIENVDVFYPNAVKEGEVYDDEAIDQIIANTNRSINDGAQQPALLEGHTSPIEKILSNQKRPWGYAVNWRVNPAKAGFVCCDLIKVDPEFIRKQRARPLTGLSPGIVKDAGGLGKRFDHVAVLGSSLQALSALPRTELSAIYSSNQVCFSAEALNFLGVPAMTLNDENKKAVSTMADCYAAHAAAMKSYAAGEPHSWEKVKESTAKLQTHFGANKSLFESAMPDDPLVKHAMQAVKGNPGKGVAIRKDPTDDLRANEKDKDANFDSEDFAAEQHAQAARIAELEGMLSQTVRQLNQKNFEAEIDALTAAGHQLPSRENINQMYEVCYSSENPGSALDALLGMFKSAPRTATPAGVGTVLGAAGASAVAGGSEASIAKARATNRTLYQKALGTNFSSDQVEFGHKFHANFQAELAKRA